MDPLDLVRETGTERLSILPAGMTSHPLSTLIHSERLGTLLNRLRSKCDLILIDSAPLLLVPESRVLARSADALVLVLRAGVTTVDVAVAARRRAIEDHVPLIGTILNDWKPETGRLLRLLPEEASINGLCDHSARSLRRIVGSYPRAAGALTPVPVGHGVHDGRELLRDGRTRACRRSRARIAGARYRLGILTLRNVPPLPSTLLTLLILANVVSFYSPIDEERAFWYIFVTAYLVLSWFFFVAFLQRYETRGMDVLIRAYTFSAMFCVTLGALSYFHLSAFQDYLLLVGRLKGLFKDPNVCGPYLIPGRIVCLGRHHPQEAGLGHGKPARLRAGPRKSWRAA